MHILLIEDDQLAAEYLLKGLTESGHVVDHAANGDDGLHLAITGEYDVLVVDRMLPKRDGLSIIRMLRADNKYTPALILSALGEVDDRVTGLKAGGDDYLVKPFAFAELLARIEVLARRHYKVVSVLHLKVGDLSLDIQKQQVKRIGQTIRLQPREYKLLEFLMRHADQVVTHTMLLEQVWDFHFNPHTNVIGVQMSRLRSKIDRPFDKPLLHTVRGAGYKISEQS